MLSVRTIVPPQPEQGAVVSGGVAAHGVTSWHAAGFRGRGVKIGVIDLSFEGFAGLMGSELPATVNARCYSGIGNFTANLTDCISTSSPESHRLHGTAVTEAIFDIAPQADYYIADTSSYSDLLNTVNWMASQGVDVINMSLGWTFNGPGDGTAYYSNAPLDSVDAAVRGGIIWVNAAGNAAKDSWYGAFEDSDSDGVHEFNASGNECNGVTIDLDPLEGFTAQLRWADSWGGASKDLDLYLIPESGSTLSLSDAVATSENNQVGAGNDIPYETFSRRHGQIADGEYCLAVNQVSGAAPSWIQLLVWGASGDLQHYVSARSIGNPAESRNSGMLAAGAARVSNTNTIEGFSSRGPTIDNRTKPDIVGADGGTSSTYGTWKGTSQASPHVAGLAALVKQAYPSRSPSSIASYLKDNALGRDTVPNNTWGYGFAQLPTPPTNWAATGVPTITGTAEVGATLTADTSGIVDLDGLDNVSFSYQWIRSDGTTDWDVDGATGAAYTVAAADVDKTIKVRVSFTDDEDNVESLTSSATVAVPEATFTFKIEGTTVTCDSYNVKECDDPSSIDQGLSGEIEVEIEIARSVTSQLYKFEFRISQIEDSIGNSGAVEANDLCLGPGLADSALIETTPDDGTGPFTYLDDGTIFELCPAGTYQLSVHWYRYNYTDQEYEYAGTFRRYFFITSDDEKDTSIERVKWITALYPDPPASHDDVQVEATKESEVLNRELATFSLSIDGLVPDSDSETTDYVVRVRIIGDDGPGKTVPWCHVGNVGYSYLLKTVPEDGGWAMKAHLIGGCISHSWPDTLQIELFNGSYEYLAGKDVALGAPSNNPAAGAPTISGTAQVGETLTVDTSGIADEDGLSNAAFNYQWISNDGTSDTDIQDATGSTYTLAAADVGKAIMVRVSFTDDAGNDETLTSAATDVVAAATQPNNPATKGYVTVVIGSGDDTVSWSDPDGCSSDYNIYKAITPSGNDSETSHIHLGSAAPGSPQATLAISHREDDRYPAVEVELYCGTYDAASSQNLLISSARLSIGGTSLVGINIREGTYSSAALTALTISSGTLSPDFDRGLGPYSAEVPSDVEVITLDPTVLTGYQTDFVKNPGWYTVTICPRPPRLNCLYTYGDGTTTGIVLSDADTDTEGFQINLDRGENQLGIGVHKGPVAAGGAKTYPLTVTRAANTPATGQPTISGTAQVGQTLTADTSGIADADGLTNVWFSYQWLSNRDTEIGGATSSTYTLQASDESKAITVQVSFTDDTGNGETLTSEATDAVSAATQPNNPSTGAPTISGTAQVGETLTADTSGIADADGLDAVTFIYRWLAGDSDISGATGSTYTLADADEGKAVKVRVTFTDDAGNDETLTSAATDAVAAATQPNSPATGAPTISGTVQVGETLTADTSGIADDDGLENVSFSYQWLADDTAIQGATNSTYTLVEADEGKAIKVRVSFTDDGGNDETPTSAATATVEAAPNSPATGAPTISGTAQVGETLTADTSGISDADGLTGVTHSYQWLAGDSDISGATGSTYTLADADENKAIKVKVSLTDDAGNAETLTSAATEAVSAAPQPNNPATGAPTISGTAQVGETLTADTSSISDADGLENVTFSYQWLSSRDTEIQGATASTYTLADADESKAIKVKVSFTDDGGNDETLTSEATEAVAGIKEPVASEDVAAWSAIMTVEWVYQGYGYYSTDAKKAGSLSPASFEVDGTTYTVKMVETQGWWTYVGVDRELPFDFVLELDGARFASDDASFRSYSYGNIYRWEGTGLRWRNGDTVEVRLLRAFEDETAVNSAATGAPVISGTVQVGETLTADTSGVADEDGRDNAAFTYQWLAGDTEVAGATGSTYTLADADEGKAIKVQVSFIDDAGHDETLTSVATEEVAAAPQENNEATGAPTISGTVQVGETLTADTSGISDADGLTSVSYSYQWIRNDGNSDSAISGATASTYTLADADESKAIKVKVSFTDDASNEETLTSVATDAVAAKPNSPVTGVPTISGTAQVGETLTADTMGIADADGLEKVTLSYQWLADDTANQGPRVPPTPS